MIIERSQRKTKRNVGPAIYVIRRVLFLLPVFFGISIVTFLMMHAAGDPVSLITAENPNVRSEDLRIIYEYYELDKPLYQQYLRWLWKLLHFDLGYSYYLHSPVSTLIGNWSLETIKLQVSAIVLAVVVSVILGSVSAAKQYSRTDIASTLLGLSGVSIPVFFLGLMLLLAFSYFLPVFPSYGAYSTREPLLGNSLLDALWHMVLPVATIAYCNLALFVRLVRTSMLEILRQDYILAARASGLGEKLIIYKHALRNALIPVVTYLGIWTGTMIGYAPIAETVFSWPGLGYLYVQAITKLDLPVVMGINMVVAVMVLAANLIVDLVYCLIDPRIRL